MPTQSFLTLCDPVEYSFCPWNSPGKNTGVGSHSLLQGIFLTRDQTWVSCITGVFFTAEPPGKSFGYICYLKKKQKNKTSSIKSMWQIQVNESKVQVLFVVCGMDS